ncbi:MAG: hypothetical protein JWM54_502 [Acidobacteriaceae bacterium]|nr:hypothetical protein [Acidobacteriaceae bacterium]
MGFPRAHVSQPDATGASSSENDRRSHLGIGLKLRLSRAATAPAAKLPSDSAFIKKSSA